MVSPLVLLAAAGVVGLLYALYRWALPSPIPGIPYNEEAAGRLLGDIPDMLHEVGQTGDIVQWMLNQKLKTQSPISQVFVKPFGRPYVLVTDWRAARDVLLHSIRVFDRSTRVSDLFEGLLADHQLTKKTGPEWKSHRRLVQDTMSPAFLHSVAAPILYHHILEWVRLWDLKTRLAGERPFSATDDIFHAVLDAVFGFTFGSTPTRSAVKPQIERLTATTPEQLHHGAQDKRANAPVDFPHEPIDEVLEAILKLDAVMEDVKSSPSPRWKWWFVKRTPSFRKHAKVKDAFIHAEIANACQAHQRQAAAGAAATSDKTEPEVLNTHSATGTIVAREARLAQLEGRRPDFFSSAVRGEVFGMVVAGHDTTSTTMCWAVKLLADHAGAQTRLRHALQAAHPAAHAAKRAPAVDELLRAPVAFLDATVEEVLRCGGTIPFGDREALEDTTLLGCRIPKGTGVFFLHNGPGVRLPESAANRAKYREAAEKAAPPSRGGGHHQDIAPWDDEDVARFKPERWLRTDGDGAEETFDNRAGPSMPFSLGPRACFGRRLAYLQLRIMLAMMVWHFEFLPCPEELSDYTGVLGVVYKPKQCYVRLRKVVL